MNFKRYSLVHISPAVLPLSLLSALLIWFSVIFLSCGGEPQTYKIGAIAPLTGFASSYGLSVKNGIDLAVEEINAAGGIKGRPLEVIFKDSKGEKETAVAVIEELVKLKVPLIIGGVLSSETLAIAPIAERSEIVLLSPTASHPDITDVGAYIFRVYPSDVLEGSEAANLCKDLDLKRVAIIHEDSEYGKGLRSIFKQRLKDLKGIPLYAEAFKNGQQDFTGIIEKLKLSDPDAIYLVGYYDEISKLIQGIKAAGIKAQIISSAAFNSKKMLETLKENAEGILIVQPPFDPNSSDPAVMEFVNRYKSRFNDLPDVFGAHAYDSAKVAAQALQLGGQTGSSIQLAMSTAIKNYPGVTGTITFNSRGDVVKFPRVYIVENSQFVLFDAAKKEEYLKKNGSSEEEKKGAEAKTGNKGKK